MRVSSRRPSSWHAVPLLALLVAIPVTVPRPQSQDPAGTESAGAVDRVRSRVVEIVDAAGKTRLRLGIDDKGSPELRMLDSEGRTRLRAAVHGDREPVVLLIDEHGDNRVSAVVDRDGNPIVLLAMPGGKPVAQLSVSATGAPSLVFTHASGAVNAGIGQHADGTGWLRPAPVAPAAGAVTEPAKQPAKDTGR